MIPNKLKTEEMNFVIIEKGGKKPIQREWQNKRIGFDSDELKTHIERGGNYGVMGGWSHKLLIVDFDDEKIQEKLINVLPETFTVKTGGGLLHKYYKSDECASFKIFDEDINTLLDVQGQGKQVVGPGSTHPNGNKYEVTKDIEIAFIPYAELKAKIMPYDRRPKKEKKEVTKTNNEPRDDDLLDAIKMKVRMADVLNKIGVDTSKNPCGCPFHSSKGGKCLGFQQEVAHCFHCDDSWNIFSLVKQYKNCSFKEALIWIVENFGMQQEYDESRKKYLEKRKLTETSQKSELRGIFIEMVSGRTKEWARASELLVEYVKNKLKIFTTKDDIKTEMWVYKEGIYVPQGKSEVKMILRDLLEDWFSQFISSQVITKLEADTFIDPQDFFVIHHPQEVAVQNGILNIFNKTIAPFTPGKVFFNKMPVTYDPKAECPKIEKFLDDILPKKNDKEIFYEWGGFNLTNEHTYEKAMMCVGNGRNGKDKMLELLKRILGVENCCSIPLNSITPDSFVISELFGKKANLAGDISGKDLKDLSMFKALTGRSLISAKRKFLRDITFVNAAKFTFACNELPMVFDLSKGFWDRWILLEFPFTFVTQDEIDKNKDNINFKLRDENIIERITTPEELSGLLNKYLEGFDRLRQNKNFSATEGSEEIKRIWIRKSNSFIAFCIDEIEEDYESRISKKELRKRYSKYCRDHKVISKNDVIIKRILEDQYGVSESQGFELGLRYWEGVKWKN